MPISIVLLVRLDSPFQRKEDLEASDSRRLGSDSMENTMLLKIKRFTIQLSQNLPKLPPPPFF